MHNPIHHFVKGVIINSNATDINSHCISELVNSTGLTKSELAEN
jgi:hypothetical protein